MTKSAGFLKKLKKVGQLIGKGASWVNNNIVKPLNPVIDTALDFIPGGDMIKNVKNAASNAIDRYLPSAPTNKRIQQAVKFGADVALDTQRSKQDRKYGYYDSRYADSIYDRDDLDEDSEEDYYQPPKKTYKNPFGTRMN